MRLKKYKKVLAAGMAAVMTMGMLTGCGGGSGNSAGNGGGQSASSGGQGSSSSQNAGSGEIVPLKWVTIGNGMPTNYDAWIAKVNEYIGGKVGVSLEMEVIPWGDWDKRRNIIVSTNEPYDIIFGNGNNYIADINLGAYYDITDMIDANMPGLKQLMPDKYWDGVKVKDRIYGVPTYKDSSISNYAVWDKELVEEYDLDLASLTEIESLTDIFTTLKADKNDYPVYTKNDGVYYIFDVYDQIGAGTQILGVRYDDQDARVCFTLEEPDIYSALETLHDWYQKGIINPDAATLSEARVYNMWRVAQGWESAGITSWGPQMGKDVAVQKVGDTILSNETVRGSLNMVSINTKYPEKCLQLLDLINTDTKLRDMFYYGEEGVNFEYTEDGKAHKINNDWAMAGYTQASYFTVTQVDTDEYDQWGEIKELNEYGTGSVAYVRNLPSKGYKSFKVSQTAVEEKTPFTLVREYQLETPFYTIQLDKQGMFTSIYDKENDREVIQEGQRANLLRMYEDKPIYFDNWDIDIYYTEKYWDVDSVEHMEWTEIGAVRAVLEITRKASQSTIQQNIIFYADSRRIEFETYVDWKEHQTLLKVHFPVAVHTDEAAFDVQFGNLTRKTHQNTSWDVARFESCGQKWMDLSEGHYGVSMLNDCKYGHSVKDSNMALTLIKSGTEPNPTTDQEEHVFTYAIYPHAEGWRAAGTVAEAYKLNQPLLVQTQTAEQEAFSYASAAHANVIVETIKDAEDGSGTVLRLYESENAYTKTKLTVNADFEKAYICNLLEETEHEASVAGKEIEVVLKPYEVVTVKVV